MSCENDLFSRWLIIPCRKYGMCYKRETNFASPWLVKANSINSYVQYRMYIHVLYTCLLCTRVCCNQDNTFFLAVRHCNVHPLQYKPFTQSLSTQQEGKIIYRKNIISSYKNSYYIHYYIFSRAVHQWVVLFLFHICRSIFTYTVLRLRWTDHQTIFEFASW